jgi:hypothetical protein
LFGRRLESASRSGRNGRSSAARGGRNSRPIRRRGRKRAAVGSRRGVITVVTVHRYDDEYDGDRNKAADNPTVAGFALWRAIMRIVHSIGSLITLLEATDR